MDSEPSETAWPGEVILDDALGSPHEDGIFESSFWTTSSAYYNDTFQDDALCGLELSNNGSPSNSHVAEGDSLALPRSADFVESFSEEILCKKTSFDFTAGKCCCTACKTHTFNQELRENLGDEGPESSNVVVFVLPPDGNSEPLDSGPFLTDLSLLSPGSCAVEEAPACQDDGLARPGKRRRQPVSSQESKKLDALAQMKDAFQLSDDVQAKIQRLIAEEASCASQNTNIIRHARQMVPEFNAPSSTRDLNPVHRLCTPKCLPPVISRFPIYEQPFVQGSSHISAQNRQDTSATSSIYHEDTLNNQITLHQNHMGLRTAHSCTFPSCGRTYGSRFQWKRHEESVHKHRFMCREHNSPLVAPSGVCACCFCFARFTNIEAANTHTVDCSQARIDGTDFPRVDKLRDHLRDCHGILSPSKDAFDWCYDKEIEWAKECGFCGEIFRNWDLRADHIVDHFITGWKISDWRVPFPRMQGNKHDDPMDDSGDNSDDDDDDDESDNDDSNHDFHDHKGRGRILASNYTHMDSSFKNNELALSGMSWNYGFSNKTPLLLLDQFNVSPCTSNSEDASSQTRHVSITNQATIKEHIIPERHSNSSTSQWTVHTDLRKQSAKKPYKNSPCLEAYLIDQQQHERFLLSLGRRRPLNVYIGTKQPSESLQRPSIPNPYSLPITNLDKSCSRTPPIPIINSACLPPRSSIGLESPNPQSHDQGTCSSEKLQSWPRSSDAGSEFASEASTFDLPISLTQSCKSKRATTELREYCIDVDLMNMRSRLQFFFLGDTEQFTVGYHASRAMPNLLLEPWPHCATPATASTRSVRSNTDSSQLMSHGYGSSFNDIHSFRTTSSTAPTENMALPWHIMLTNAIELPLASINGGYYLPCEFAFLGCNTRFSPANFEDWMNHHESHFRMCGQPPPAKSVCPFCDDMVFENKYNPALSWQDRMHHVHEHYQDHAKMEDIRPDFWLIEYLVKIGAITHEDHESLISYTERPPFAQVSGLVPNNHQIFKASQRNERDMLEAYDLASEERLRNKERRVLRGKRKLPTKQGCTISDQTSFRHEISHVAPSIIKDLRNRTADQQSVFHGFVEEYHDPESGREKQPTTAANKVYEIPEYQLREGYPDGSNSSRQITQCQVSRQSSSSSRTRSPTNQIQEPVWSKATEQTNLTGTAELEVSRLGLSGSVPFPLDFSSAGPTMLENPPHSEVDSYGSEEPSTPDTLTTITTSISPSTKTRSLIQLSKSSSRKRLGRSRPPQNRDSSIINYMSTSDASSITDRAEFGSSFINAEGSEYNLDVGARKYRVPDNPSRLISAIVSRGLKYPITVVNQNTARYDVDEPRASQATHEDYKKF